jgi:hypothetical protein
MSDEELYVFMFCFFNRKDQKISPPFGLEEIRRVFYDYDWDAGFAVEEVIVDDVIENKLIIQFVSRKGFNVQLEDDPNNILNSIIGKEQFISNLFFQLTDGNPKENSLNGLEGYFCCLGLSSLTRDESREQIFEIGFSKYGELNPADVSLAAILGIR